MANRDTHDIIGISTGVLATLLSALQQGRQPSIWELLGGGLGGLGGSRAPDLLEPAHHPHHRQFAHSFMVLVGGGASLAGPSRSAQAALGGAAQRETEPVMRALLGVAGGMAIALPAGYASHVLADATTPRGIPFIGRLGGR